MIKTVIFDIGNVLTDFGWQSFFAGLGYDEKMSARLARATVQSDDWKEYDRGCLSDGEVLQLFLENDPELEADIRRSQEDLHGILLRRAYAADWVRELKAQGYQVLVLSNISDKVMRECAEALDFMELVDGGILSYQERLLKPMPEIYGLLVERYHLIPEECVFLDDTRENAEAAEKLGIHAIWFRNRQQAEEELLALGVGENGVSASKT